MSYFAGIGLGSTLMPELLWAKARTGAEINATSIAAAEELAGLKFDDAERAMMLEGLKGQEARLEALHKIELKNSVSPAIVFDPLPPGKIIPRAARKAMVRSPATMRTLPLSDEDIAFLPITELSEFIRRGQLKPTRLTEIYLERLKRYDPVLRCVISLTEDRARAQAKKADAEIARGYYRGPLHGIPWGAKDLLAVKGYKTTWGAGPYK